ncbi:MAG: hypothetical protein HY326_11100 [Chloroflexi bacterium]|nr:hypothetical protein [Chloroflexota bacterium]
MIFGAAVHFVIALLFRFPKIAGLVGLLIALASGYFGIEQWNSWRNLPNTAEQMSLAEMKSRIDAGEKVWGDVRDAKWDCQNIIYSELVDKSINTEAVFTNDTLTAWGVANFSKKISCDEILKIKVTGGFRLWAIRLMSVCPAEDLISLNM